MASNHPWPYRIGIVPILPNVILWHMDFRGQVPVWATQPPLAMLISTQKSYLDFHKDTPTDIIAELYAQSVLLALVAYSDAVYSAAVAVQNLAPDYDPPSTTLPSGGPPGRMRLEINLSMKVDGEEVALPLRRCHEPVLHRLGGGLYQLDMHPYADSPAVPWLRSLSINVLTGRIEGVPVAAIRTSGTVIMAIAAALASVVGADERRGTCAIPITRPPWINGPPGRTTDLAIPVLDYTTPPNVYDVRAGPSGSNAGHYVAFIKSNGFERVSPGWVPSLRVLRFPADDLPFTDTPSPLKRILFTEKMECFVSTDGFNAENFASSVEDVATFASELHIELADTFPAIERAVSTLVPNHPGLANLWPRGDDTVMHEHEMHASIGYPQAIPGISLTGVQVRLARVGRGFYAVHISPATGREPQPYNRPTLLRLPNWYAGPPVGSPGDVIFAQVLAVLRQLFHEAEDDEGDFAGPVLNAAWSNRSAQYTQDEVNLIREAVRNAGRYELDSTGGPTDGPRPAPQSPQVQQKSYPTVTVQHRRSANLERSPGGCCVIM